MPADLRNQLEAAADKSGKNVSQELLRRLQDSFHRDRVKSVDPAIRALCFLFERIAEVISWPPFVVRPWPWRSSPFLFTAFKLAVNKLLDVMQPAGDIESPLVRQPGDFYRRMYETPETLSDYVVSFVWTALHKDKAPNEFEEEMRKRPEDREARSQVFYGMLNARRDLGIKL